MTDRAAPAGVLPDSRSAGQLLREARLRQGLDAATLAGLIKVPVARIEALESDRHEALPGVAFTRGLALSICRVLKIDPQPVLDRLPRTDGETLDEVSRGLNAPFREARGTPLALDLSLLRRPIVWAPLLFALAAAALWLAPIPPIGETTDLLGRPPAAVSPAPPAAPGSAAIGATPAADVVPGGGHPVAAASAESTRVEVVHAAPPVFPSAAASGPAGSATVSGSVDPSSVASALQLRSSGTSWVEVRDARGAVLLSRTLQPGEAVALTGALPLQAVVGNASQTSAVVRGQAFDITPYTRENVARFEVR